MTPPASLAVALLIIGVHPVTRKTLNMLSHLKEDVWPPAQLASLNELKCASTVELIAKLAVTLRTLMSATLVSLATS